MPEAARSRKRASVILSVSKAGAASSKMTFESLPGNLRQLITSFTLPSIMDNTEFDRYMDTLDTSLKMPIKPVTGMHTKLLVSNFAVFVQHHLDGYDVEESESDMPIKSKQKKKGRSQNRFGYFHTHATLTEHGPLPSATSKQEKRKKSLHTSTTRLRKLAPGMPLGDALQDVVQQVVAELGWNEADDYSLTKYLLILVVEGQSQENIASELSKELLELKSEDTAASHFAEWLFQQIDMLTGKSVQDPEMNTMRTVAVCYRKQTKVWDDLARVNLKKKLMRKMVRKVRDMRRSAFSELWNTVHPFLLVSKQFALDLREYLQCLKKDLDSFKRAASQCECSLVKSEELSRVKETIWNCFSEYRHTLGKESSSIDRCMEKINKWQMCHPCWRIMPVELSRKSSCTGWEAT